ncbi:hypothetical protein ACLOJK_020481 [Asimina triloba]
MQKITVNLDFLIVDALPEYNVILGCIKAVGQKEKPLRHQNEKGSLLNSSSRGSTSKWMMPLTSMRAPMQSSRPAVDGVLLLDCHLLLLRSRNIRNQGNNALTVMSSGKDKGPTIGDDATIGGLTTSSPCHRWFIRATVYFGGFFNSMIH